MARNPTLLETLARLDPGADATEEVADWTENALALMGPAPFLDPFARARRAHPAEVSA